MTQEELAKAAGTTKSAISRLECARQIPSLRTLAKIAEALDADLSVTLISRESVA
jgi:transcriptional regulator with XRE-family HTH domain